MPSPKEITQNYGTWKVQGEFDLTTAGAILASRGDGLVFTKTGTGTYTVRVINEIFVEVLHRNVEVNRATATAGIVNISSIDVDGAGDGTGAVITIQTLDDNATPTATDQATGTVSFSVTFRKWKI
jgi:hypothetical protein